MLVLVNDRQHWKGRAAEMRALADWMTASETQAIILRLASDYELLAVHAAYQRLFREIVELRAGGNRGRPYSCGRGPDRNEVKRPPAPSDVSLTNLIRWLGLNGSLTGAGPSSTSASPSCWR
jgi:hypothetical protein